MEREEFEKYIEEALFAIPEHIRDRIENVAFVLEDDPRRARGTERVVKSKGILLGLYEGVPLGSRGPWYSGALPDKITLFKHAIERVAGPDNKKIRNLIHEVVHHEVGHFLGMDERRVRAWESKKRTRKPTPS